MRTIAVDVNNDLEVTTNNLSLKSGIFEIMQSCEQAVKTQLGEVIYNTKTGVPNFQTIWQSGANIAQFESHVKQMILGVEGVTSISKFNASIRNNLVVYSATIKTIYGEGNIGNDV